MAVPMANHPPFATLNHFAADLGIPSESKSSQVGISALSWGISHEAAAPWRPCPLVPYSAVMMPALRIPGLDRIASWLLFAAAALAPLPFGSSQPAAVALWCVVLGLTLAIAPTNKLREPHLKLLGC